MGAGVIIAGMALYTWKKEFIGKKKIDLACDIVEQVCNIQDIIRYARDPFSFTNEQDKIKEDLNSKKIEVKDRKLCYLVVRYRLYDNRNEITNFVKLRNKAQLYWDKDILNLFNKINEIISSINIASDFLYDTDDLDFKSKKEYKNKIWHTHNDEIETKVQKIVDEFKLNLEPLYKDRLTKWKNLK